MKRIAIVMAALALLLSHSLWAADKKRVAILDFEFGTVQQWWSGNWDIGKGISDLLVDQLVRDGTFSVIERSRLDAVLAEQNFSNSQRADAASAAQIGRVLGVNAIIVGSITQFGVEQNQKSVGGALGRWSGFGGARVGTSKGKAKVIINARLIDINTGEILAVAEGEGVSSRSGLLLGGFGGGRGGFGAGEISMGSSDFRETVLGEAVHAAVSDLADEVEGSEPKIPTVQRQIRGLVADVEGALVILNVGRDVGVKAGDLFSVQRVVRTVKDPATGEVLREITQEVGQVRIDEVDERSSVARLLTNQAIQVADVVELIGQ